MSLDVYLYMKDAQVPRTGTGIFIRENGTTREISREEWDRNNPGWEPVVVEASGATDCVYSANITHNLNKMAEAAGLYTYLWRPDELGIVLAHELVMPLRCGLQRLLEAPQVFRQFNPANGWGTYEGLVEFVEKYLTACLTHPNATVEVWR